MSKAAHVLIVGGTRGMGKALARHWCSQGFAVSVLGRGPVTTGRGSPAGMHFVQADLQDAAACVKQVAKAIAARGHLRHLAFFQRWRGAGDPWAGEMSVTLNATRTLVEACAKRFDGTGDHGIVFVGSLASRLVFAEQPAGYHAAKAALLQLARFYAVQLGPAGIRVNVVTPDAVIKEENQRFYARNARLRKTLTGVIPLRRMGSDQDVARAVDFLCSPGASYITGQELVVDGGLSLLGPSALVRQFAARRR